MANKRLNRKMSSKGYVYIRAEDHPKVNASGFVFEHILVAEKALGKYLPEKAVIHHVNEVVDDNRPANLVICPGSKYHAFLHKRMRAKKACGHVDWPNCVFCKKHDNPINMTVRSPVYAYHKKCAALYSRDRKSATRYFKSRQSNGGI